MAISYTTAPLNFLRLYKSFTDSRFRFFCPYPIIFAPVRCPTPTSLSLSLAMTPAYLNPPPSAFQLVQQKDEQHLKLLQSSLRSPSSLSRPTSSNSSSSIQDQRMQRDQKCEGQAGSSHELKAFPSSSIRHQSMADNTTNGYKQSSCKREVGEGSTNDNGTSAKWMSSKMRLMQKMNNSNNPVANESVKSEQNFQHLQLDYNETNSINHSNSAIRVCTDCNTTTTPLWRSGPHGPKSLCNACGIRQRKARRAMEAAATDNSSMKIKTHNKEKKSRASHVAQYKKQWKSTPDSPLHDQPSQRKLCFKDFASSLSSNSALERVFPQDVEDAAVLLMELSCGFTQN